MHSINVKCMPPHFANTKCLGRAAMVFEETASHKPQSWPTWNHWSALVPKAPAQSDVSPPDAQTHRLLVQSMQFIQR